MWVHQNQRRWPRDVSLRPTRHHKIASALKAAIEPLEHRLLLTAAPLSHAPRLLTPPLAHFAHQSNTGVSPSIISTPFTPDQVRSAYGVDSVSFNGISADGAGQTIAIVDAQNDPDIITDANTFSNNYNLPLFNSGGPSLSVLDQQGGTNLPANASSTTGNWDVEESLDVEWAHAIAPEANIILFEAKYPDVNDLFLAASEAAAYPGVSVVSMSFGAQEFSGEKAYDSDFKTPAGHQGVTFLASTGDAGEPALYPSLSPNVIAVGGTSLTIFDDGSYGGETGWAGSGGGISDLETQPSYQTSKITALASKNRSVPDVAMLADPSTGVNIVDSFSLGGLSGRWGGTSLASPIWAALIAIANEGRALNGLPSLDGASQTLPLLYRLPSTDFHDITSGNNGSAAGPGYDLVTGLGSPRADLIVPALASYTAGQLAISASFPGSSVAGATLAKFTVQVQDANGNVLSSDNSPVTLSIASGPAGGSLSGTTTVNAVNGTATFSDIAVNKAGSYSIAASDGLFATDTAALNITPANAAKLAFTHVPANAKVGSATNTVSVSVEDQFGNVIGSDSSKISLTIENGANEIGNPIVASANDGVATFTIPLITLSGNYSLSASDGTLTPGNATLTLNPAAANRFTISAPTAASSGSSFNATVTVFDQYNNKATSYAGLAHFTSSDGWAILPSDSKLTNGSGTFPVTLLTAGTQTVTVVDSVDSSITDTVSVKVSSSGPAIAKAAAVNMNPVKGSAATLSVLGSDQAGESTLIYTWSLSSSPATVGYSVNGTNSAKTTVVTFHAVGTYNFVVTIGDASNLTTTSSVTVNVTTLGPGVASAAKANPLSVTKTSTALTVLGSDAAGESALKYTWATTGTVPASVKFSANGTNAAKNTTATFTAAGKYTFIVTIKDPTNLTITSSVTVTVNQTLTSISISPGTVSVSKSATQNFTAVGKDQFGAAMKTQPAFTWSLATGSVGAISSGGTYTAPATAGKATIRAASGSIAGTATVSVVSQPVQVNLAGSFNRVGFTTDGSKVSSTGIDGANNIYSATAILNGSLPSRYKFGSANVNDVIAAAGQSIALPSGNFSTLTFLGTAIGGYKTGKAFVVHYTDGSTQTYSINVSDWHLSKGFAQETVAQTMLYTNTTTGGRTSGTTYLYQYSLALNASKTVASITLPSNTNSTIVMAMNLNA